MSYKHSQSVYKQACVYDKALNYRAWDDAWYVDGQMIQCYGKIHNIMLTTMLLVKLWLLPASGYLLCICHFLSVFLDMLCSNKEIKESPSTINVSHVWGEINTSSFQMIPPKWLRC